ncbi:hypothetical protein Stsp02_48110 [Streptomyces sp. NBRC 14336]|nr:hypothetical protein Stsp02_48110 [Streptomyces sp. NBRC 14336]
MPEFVLEFFGTLFHVTGMEGPELSYFFGPHLLGLRRTPEKEKASLTVHLGQRSGSGGRGVRVFGPDGRLLRRWSFHGMGGIPPLLPPFAAMNGQYAVVQAAVLAEGDRVVALIGGVGSPRNSVALALGGRGWRMVSSQYLVVDRATGHTLPYQLPMELRGVDLDAVRAAGLADGPDALDGVPDGSPGLAGLAAENGAGYAWSGDLRRVQSPLTGPYLQVRPERLLATVDRGARLGPAHLVRLCCTGTDRCELEEWDVTPSVWPPEAADDLPAASRSRLLLPGTRSADEAADLLHDRLMPVAAGKGTALCPAEPPTPRERPAGSTTWGSTRPAPRSSTQPSSVGSSDARAAVATT